MEGWRWEKVGIWGGFGAGVDEKEGSCGSGAVGAGGAEGDTGELAH